MGPLGPDPLLAAGAAAAAPAGGAGGAGIQTGSTGASVPAGAGGAGLAACLRERFGVSAGAWFAAAGGGVGLLPGSGFMMLTAGIEAADGKSMLTILCGGDCAELAGAAALASATGTSTGWFHIAT